MSTSDRDPRAPIVVAYSPSSSGREPVEFGIAASRVTGAPLTILMIRHGGTVVNLVAGAMEEGDAPSLEHLRLDLQRRRVKADVIVRDARTAGAGLIAAMEELSPQMMVLAANRDSAVGAVVIGTTIERVVHATRCPVAVVPLGYAPPERGVERIGVAYTPTPEGTEALRAAASLARAGGVGLRAITVLDPEHAGEDDLRDARAEAGPDLDLEVDVRSGDPSDELVAASRDVDLLVIGSRARGARRATVLGSVSRKVAEGGACPVLIVARAATGTAGDLFSRAVVEGPS